MKTIKKINQTLLLYLAISVCHTLSAQSIQYYRPADQSGINQFETSKIDTTVYKGLKVRVGGNLAIPYQMLRDSNNPNPLNAANTPIKIGNGFDLASANLNLDVQLEDGVRLNLVTYLASRHHEDTWVKGGYLQFDKLAFLHSPLIDKLMQNSTIKIGEMEINYGDYHYRRTDNGNSIYNPFEENLIMDAFATEVAGEFYYHPKSLVAMLAISNGELKDDVSKVGVRAPAVYGKLGFDQQFDSDLRVRLTGSFYYTNSSASNTLFAGDRAGSRYFLVLATTNDFTSPHTTGRWSPGFSDRVATFVINPFIKFHGLELMGNLETAKGRSAAETTRRNVNQYAVDAVYRFLPGEKLFVGARYNSVTGELSTGMNSGSVNRVALCGGWFLTRNVMMKAEYVNQQYNGFPDNSIYHEGEFHGVMFEAAIGF